MARITARVFYLLAASASAQAAAMPLRGRFLQVRRGPGVAQASMVGGEDGDFTLFNKGLFGDRLARQKLLIMRLARQKLFSMSMVPYNASSNGNVSALAEAKALETLKERVAAEAKAFKKFDDARKAATSRGVPEGIWSLSGEGAAADAGLKRARRERERAATYAPPYSFHGSFRDRNFSDVNYPLRPEWIAPLMPEGNWERLRPLMQRLEAGGRAKIIVFGGSVTQGTGCHQDFANGSHVGPDRLNGPPGKDCAWPSRFAEWLRVRYPRSTIDMRNLAFGGASTLMHLSTLGVTMKTHGSDGDIDAIMLDQAVNGDGGIGVYEQMVRVLHKLVPKAAIVCVEVSREGYSKEQVNVAEHYGLPIINLLHLTSKNKWLWERSHVFKANGQKMDDMLHAHWRTHQIVADFMANMWGKAWHTPPSKTTEVAFPTKPLNPQAVLDRLRVCEDTLSLYSAFDPALAQPKVLAGNWTLKEDRVGKPGWIAEGAKGSKLRFPIRVGPDPQLQVAFLRSYELLGDATAVLAPASGAVLTPASQATLSGRWETTSWESLGRVSQADVFRFDLPKDLSTRSLNLDIEANGDEKVKIIAVSSC